VDLALSTQHEGVYTIIECTGELDIATVTSLRERFADLIAGGHHDLVVDLQGVEFMDSTGLGVLVGGLKRLDPYNGSFQLVCTRERILRIFRITGLINVFSITPQLRTRSGPPNDRRGRPEPPARVATSSRSLRHPPSVSVHDRPSVSRHCR